MTAVCLTISIAARPARRRAQECNLIMVMSGKLAIVTDTHHPSVTASRLVDNVKGARYVESSALWKIISEEGNTFCHRLVDHGRVVCTARAQTPRHAFGGCLPGAKGFLNE